MRRVHVASVGLTKVADHWQKSLLDLAVEAGFRALDNASGCHPQAVVVGNMFSGVASRQEQLGALVATRLGLDGVGAHKVEAAGASGAIAVATGASLIRSGEADCVLVMGVEKMRDLEPSAVTEAVTMAENAEFTQFFGVSYVAMNAMLARLYMNEFNVTRDALSSFAVLAHRNAVSAEHAQFRKAIGPEDVARSVPVSEPLRLLDCAPVGDGAAAILLTAERPASAASLVELVSSATATNRFSLHERDDMLDFAATRAAVTRALRHAGVSLRDIDLFEIHDAFSPMAALSVEAIGLSKRGEGASDAQQGKFDLHGDAPISTFGGLKGRGNPVGATGVYQVAEAGLQLMRQAGPNQVRRARIALTHSLGGIDTTSVVHVLRAEAN